MDTISQLLEFKDHWISKITKRCTSLWCLTYGLSYQESETIEDAATTD